MNITCVLGWAEDSAIKMLMGINVLPENSPFDGEPYDMVEFAASLDGFDYIEDTIDVINKKHNACFQVIYVRNTQFILIWKALVCDNVGKKDSQPVQSWEYSHDDLIISIDSFVDKFPNLTPPGIIICTDCVDLDSISESDSD